MKTYFSFDGYASRSQFWGTTLIGGLIFVIAFFFSMFLIGTGSAALLGILFLIATIIGYAWLQISLIVRRCRDAGLNPLWTIATFVPYIGFITFVVIGVLPTV